MLGLLSYIILLVLDYKCFLIEGVYKMIYLPKKWIINPANEERIRELLEDLYSDLKFEDSITKEEVIKELQRIKEYKIIRNLSRIY